MQPKAKHDLRAKGAAKGETKTETMRTENCGKLELARSLSVPSFLYVSDSPLVSMERKKGIRTAADSVQSGWPLWHAAKSKTQSSRRRS
ncbi:hypothetical protein TNCV_293511 [Trichonephila clavipes]|nr:hypothetical protein TNCV_293511 [Trichonephila clavipes]